MGHYSFRRRLWQLDLLVQCVFELMQNRFLKNFKGLYTEAIDSENKGDTRTASSRDIFLLLSEKNLLPGENGL